jgi:hypothetical protein
MLRIVNLIPGGTLRESRGPSVGKGRESVVVSRHLQGGSSCLCWLRTNGLVPASKYLTYWSYAGDMGPVNRCSQSSIDACVFPLLQWMLGEGNWVGTRGSVSRRAVNWMGALFLMIVDPFNSIDDNAKGCHVRLVMSADVSCVSGFSYRMYINLNRRDSQIWVIAYLVAAST